MQKCGKNKMIILSKNKEDAKDLVYNILNQGDSRYNDPEREETLADFLLNLAIILEKKEIYFVEEFNEKFEKFLEIQGNQKSIGKELLKIAGFKEQNIYFERRLMGYQPDIFAESEDKLVVVECCSCKIKKIIAFLEKVDEIWILTKGYPPWENPKDKSEAMEWFVFRKGENWDKTLIQYKKEIYEAIKNVRNPLDRI